MVFQEVVGPPVIARQREVQPDSSTHSPETLNKSVYFSGLRFLIC